MLVSPASPPQALSTHRISSHDGNTAPALVPVVSPHHPPSSTQTWGSSGSNIAKAAWANIMWFRVSSWPVFELVPLPVRTFPAPSPLPTTHRPPDGNQSSASNIHLCSPSLFPPPLSQGQTGSYTSVFPRPPGHTSGPARSPAYWSNPCTAVSDSGQDRFPPPFVLHLALCSANAQWMFVEVSPDPASVLVSYLKVFAVSDRLQSHFFSWGNFSRPAYLMVSFPFHLPEPIAPSSLTSRMTLPRQTRTYSLPLFVDHNF